MHFISCRQNTNNRHVRIHRPHSCHPRPWNHHSPPPPHPIHCSQSLYVEVLEQNYVIVVIRAGAGLPLSFRVLRAIFSISVLFALSWIPRIAVLLFFPQWVDPACSPVYCHRKLLVSRGATAAAAI